MNPSTAPRRNNLAGLLLGAGALALVAYFFWPQAKAPEATPSPAATPLDQSRFVAPANPGQRALPPGAVAWLGDIPVDAEGRRVVNEAGLPYSDEPLPVAKPVPVKAPAGTVVGYTKDAQGNTQPIRAGDLKQVPNTPGSFVVVDMWADGGPAVVPPTQGKLLSEAELAKRRAEEAARDRASQQTP